jgi:hypothetical protein
MNLIARSSLRRRQKSVSGGPMLAHAPTGVVKRSERFTRKLRMVDKLVLTSSVI